MKNVDKDLDKRDKPELVAIIKHMLRQQSELQWLLTTPLPIDSPRKLPIDPETYRSQIEAALRDGSNYRRARLDKGFVQRRLSAIKAIADEFAQQEDYFGAVTIYEVLVTDVLEHYNQYHDEYIAFSVIINGCIDGLDTCFAGEEDSKEMREKVIRLLFAIYRFYTNTGMDLDDNIPGLLLGNTTSEEKQLIAAWVHEARSAGKGAKQSSGYGYEKYNAFLLKLEKGSAE